MTDGRNAADILLAADARRPRSLQKRIGPSAIGGCERAAKHLMLGTEPTHPGGSMQAVLGTIIDAAIGAELVRAQEAGEIPPEDMVQFDAEFAGISGHGDRYESASKTVVDDKTTSQNWLDYLIEHGIGQEWTYQTAWYAAGLIKRGIPVEKIRIDVIARDTGTTHSFERPFDFAEVLAAKAWVDRVDETPVEQTDRENPSGPFCKNCEFQGICWPEQELGRHPRAVIFREQPDAEKWVDQLVRGRALQAEGKELADEARQVLDALRPTATGKSQVDIGLLDRVLSFSVSARAVTLNIVKRPAPKKPRAKKEKS